jgi:hypothetical protein
MCNFLTNGPTILKLIVLVFIYVFEKNKVLGVEPNRVLNILEGI